MLAELVVNPVHLAYGVMVVGIVFTFIFSRLKKFPCGFDFVYRACKGVFLAFDES